MEKFGLALKTAASKLYKTVRVSSTESKRKRKLRVRKWKKKTKKMKKLPVKRLKKFR